MYRRSGELFKELRSETRPRDLVRQMSGGQRQAVAIARTRLSDPKIVLMDEPTAAISVRQVAEVLNLIRRLRDTGIGVILISHRMPDVFAVADRIVVLRRGRKVADKQVAGFIAGRSDWPDHRRHTDGVIRPTANRGSDTNGSFSSRKPSVGQTYGPIGHLLSQQTFWVFVAAVAALHLSVGRQPRHSDTSATSSTWRATAPLSASSHSA